MFFISNVIKLKKIIFAQLTKTSIIINQAYPRHLSLYQSSLFDYIILKYKKKRLMQYLIYPNSCSSARKLIKVFCHLIGGLCFLVGSMVSFPIFRHHLKVVLISSTFFIAGSATLLIAAILTIAELLIMRQKQKSLFVTSLIDIYSSALYLMASVDYLPNNNFQQGITNFIWGSIFIMGVSVWRLVRIFTQKDKTYKQCYKSDQMGVLVNLFAILGGLMILLGSFGLQTLSYSQNIIDISILIYSFGGLFIFASAIYSLKKHYQVNNQFLSTDSSDQFVAL